MILNLNFGRHYRGLLERAVNPAEMEMETEPDNGMLMIIRSFAKIDRQARITAAEQPQVNIQAL